jgi:hypothetical protein
MMCFGVFFMCFVVFLGKSMDRFNQIYCIESEILKKILKKKIGLAKLSYLQDPMSDRNFFLSATLHQLM